MSHRLDFPTRTVTLTDSPYQMVGSDGLVLVDAVLGAVTVRLPAPGPMVDRMVAVKKVDTSISLVSVEGTGGALIDGLAARTLVGQWDARLFVSDGTNWYQLAQFP